MWPSVLCWAPWPHHKRRPSLHSRLPRRWQAITTAMMLAMRRQCHRQCRCPTAHGPPLHCGILLHLSTIGAQRMPRRLVVQWLTRACCIGQRWRVWRTSCVAGVGSHATQWMRPCLGRVGRRWRVGAGSCGAAVAMLPALARRRLTPQGCVCPALAAGTGSGRRRWQVGRRPSAVCRCWCTASALAWSARELQRVALQRVTAARRNHWHTAGQAAPRRCRCCRLCPPGPIIATTDTRHAPAAHQCRSVARHHRRANGPAPPRWVHHHAALPRRQASPFRRCPRCL